MHRKKQSTILICIFFLTTALACGPSQEDYSNLKSELDELKLELKSKESELEEVKTDLEHCGLNVKELRDNPIERLARARQLEEDNDEVGAESEFKDLIDRYPDSSEAQSAKDALAKIEKNRNDERIAKEKEQEELERKKRLGFKALKTQNPVKVGPLSLKFNSIKSQNRWIMDRYGSRYHYRDTRRGYKYVVADISISSESNYPKLPPVQLYKVKNEYLVYIGTLGYEFYRWDDYGSYLGNYSDYDNDFAHTKTIRFTTGYEISEDELNDNTIFVLVKDQMCFERKQERFSRPAVEYSGIYCDNKKKLYLDEVDKEYTVIKIFNKNKL